MGRAAKAELRAATRPPVPLGSLARACARLVANACAVYWAGVATVKEIMTPATSRWRREEAATPMTVTALLGTASWVATVAPKAAFTAGVTSLTVSPTSVREAETICSCRGAPAPGGGEGVRVATGAATGPPDLAARPTPRPTPRPRASIAASTSAATRPRRRWALGGLGASQAGEWGLSASAAVGTTATTGTMTTGTLAM